MHSEDGSGKADQVNDSREGHEFRPEPNRKIGYEQSRQAHERLTHHGAVRSKAKHKGPVKSGLWF